MRDKIENEKNNRSVTDCGYLAASGPEGTVPSGPISSKTKAVFFDRDGVLNVDKDYLHSIDALEWVEGAKEAVAYLTQQGYTVFVVTNQSGIARGYYAIEDMERLHAHMAGEIAAAGGKITKFYYCPHLIGAKVKEYDVDCDCRKPKPGLLYQAMAEYSIDKDKSFLIGDKPRDIESAAAAGIKGYLYESGNLLEFVKKILAEG